VKVLIADDDSVSLRLLQRTLESAGYEVTAVNNGADALERLRPSDGPRLALLDWVMPGMNGPDVCRAIRSERQQAYIHMILLSSKNSKQDLVEGLDSGADDYLIKPFDPRELKARLRTGLRILELEDSLVEAREQMRFKATHDHLTSLINRGVILDLMARELSRTARQDGCTTVLLCDLDHFKSINDTYGHPVGDEVLREVARRLLLSCRSYDFVGRYGGEEFLIVLNDCDVVHSIGRAEEFRKAIAAAPIRTVQGLLDVTMSVGGFASRDQGHLSPEEVLRETDNALYAAKASGRNCIRMASTLVPSLA
jgi:two-component system, cell cycle response regulator